MLYTRFVLLLLAIFVSNCSLRRVTTDARINAIVDTTGASGALAIEDIVINDITLALLKSGNVNRSQAAALAQGALSLMDQKEQGTSLWSKAKFYLTGSSNFDRGDITQIAPVIVEGMFGAMKGSGAALTDDKSKIGVAQITTKTMFVSLNDKIKDLPQDKKLKLPGAIANKAVGSLDNGGVSTKMMAAGIGTVVKESTGGLSAAGFTKSELTSAVKQVAQGSMQGLASSGLGAKFMAGAAKSLMANAVSGLGALKASGLINTGEISNMVGPMMQSAVGTLGTLTLGGSSGMQDVVGQMMSGAVGGLSGAGLSSMADIKNAVGDCTQSALAGLGDAGVSVSDMTAMVDNVVGGAISALGDAGVGSASDIQDMSSSIASSAISAAVDIVMAGNGADSGVSNADLINMVSKNAASGTMNALGDLSSSGLITADEMMAATTAVTQEATSTLYDKSQGTDLDLSNIMSNFSEGMVSGLAMAGVNQDTLNAVAGNISDGIGAALSASGDTALLTACQDAASSSASNWVDSMQLNCTQAGGTWNANGTCDYSQIVAVDNAVLDVTPPTAPSAVGFGLAYTSSVDISLSWVPSQDDNFLAHNVMLCTDGGCSAGCAPMVQTADSFTTITLSDTEMAKQKTYHGCVQGVDASNNHSAWVASIATITVDITPPAAITGVAFNATVTNSPQLTLSWSGGTDVNPAAFEIMTCADAACSSSCSAITISTVSSATLTASNGDYYYGCVRAVDKAGNASDWAGSQQPVIVNMTGPMVAAITSPTANGSYTAGGTVTFSVLFSEPVIVVDDAGLGITLATGANNRLAVYTSGSGTNTLVFTYTVQSGDTSLHLDYITGSPFSVGSGSIKDAAGNNATLTLPTAGAAGSISAQKAIVIDASPPAVNSISTATTSGFYRLGATVPIFVQFSKPVIVVNGANLGITLATGASNRLATYTSGSGTSSLLFTYTVQTGDTSSHLDYLAGTSLATGSGSIKDAAGNNATLTLPTPGAAGSIGAQKTIVIDTTNPTNPGNVGFPGGSPSASTSFGMNWTSSSDLNFGIYNIKICSSGDCSTLCTSTGATAATSATMTGAAGSTYYGCVQGQDLAGNTSAWIASGSTLTITATPPTSPTISIAGGASSTSVNVVTLTLGATGATQMYVTNVAGCIGGGAWESYATNKQWMTLPIQGTATVYAKYRNASLAESSCVNASILYNPSSYAISAGNSHACALLIGGLVKCWGSNTVGELGNGTTVAYGTGGGQTVTNASLVSLGGGLNAIQVGAGKHSLGDSYATSCALLSNGKVTCWGYNGYGQLGLGSSADQQTPSTLNPIDLGSGVIATQIAVGGSHVCALSTTGAIKCWGKGNLGAIASGNTASLGMYPSDMGSNLLPVDLGSGAVAVSVVAGADHSCAILDDGVVKCWGSNAYGQLGLGDLVNRGDGTGAMGNGLPAVSLGTGKTAVRLAAGSFHTCAILNDGSVKCWGLNSSGQLGINSNVTTVGATTGTMGGALASVQLGAGRMAIDIALGNSHSCALLDDHTVKCWGNNSYGQLGINSVNPLGDGTYGITNGTAAINLGTGNLAYGIAAGEYFNCAISNSNYVTCWGKNSAGALGMGSVISTLGTGASDLPSGLSVQLFMNPRIYIVPAAGGGNMGGVSGADAICNSDSNKPVTTTLYKAILSDGVSRIACTSSNCVASGVAENVDWVLEPNTTYARPDQTVIGTTTAAGIFTSANAITTSTHEFWTGLSYYWVPPSSLYTCNEWTSSTPGVTGQMGRSEQTGGVNPLFTYDPQDCSHTDVGLACAEMPLPSQCFQAYTTLSNASRNVAYTGSSSCDNAMNNTWYRFSGAAGTMIPNSAVAGYHCGTDAPGWMNGTYPSIADGVVSRTVCYNFSSNTCFWSNSIHVVNCGSFYLFQLPPPAGGGICNLNYCATN